jgi:hypothetical protein
MAAMLALLSMAAGCASGRFPVQPATGFLFTSYKAPLMFHAVASPQDISAQEAAGGFEAGGGGANGERIDGLRTARADAASLVVPQTYGFGSFGWGDMSLAQAARGAGLREVVYADYEYLSILGVYNRATIVLHGR